jgi:hypothetical protein
MYIPDRRCAKATLPFEKPPQNVSTKAAIDARTSGARRAFWRSWSNAGSPKQFLGELDFSFLYSATSGELDETERQRIHAIAKSGWFGTIIEDMAEMRIA